jgi:hypothetical protein
VIEVSDFKYYNKLDGTGTDNFISVAINYAIDAVENYCNRKLVYGQYTQYSDGNNSQTLFLKNYPVKSVDSLQVYNGTSFENIFSGSDSTANSSFLIAETNSVELINGYCFPKGRKNIKTLYTSGFSSGEVYPDIKGVILEIATVFYNNSPTSNKGYLGLSSITFNSNTSEGFVFKDLTPSWKSTLRKYRRASY